VPAGLSVHEVTRTSADLPELSHEHRELLDEMGFSGTSSFDLLSAGTHAAVGELALSIVVMAQPC
jgi:hypothetical protein